MTTGNRSLDARVNVTVQTSRGPSVWPVGEVTTRSWSGGDSKSSAINAPVADSSKPPKPSDLERRKNESSRSFKSRKAEAKRVRDAWRESTKKRPRVKKVMGPNNYTLTYLRDFYAPYEHFLSSGGVPVGYQSYANPFASGHVPLPAQEHYKLIEKLYSRAYGSGFHPGIFAAEFPQAVRMIGNASTQLRLGLLSLASGNWRGVVRNLGNPEGNLYGRARYSYLSFQEGRMSLSKAWLAFQYGWKPLVGDIEKGAQYVAYALSDNSRYDRRVSAKDTFHFTARTAPPSSTAFGLAWQKTTHRVKYVVHVRSTANQSTLPSLASVASVAWEIMPYSFVCDWVAPISGYLSACRYAAGLTGTVVLSIKSETDFFGPEGGSAVLKTPSPRCLFQVPRQKKMINFTRTVSQQISPPTPLGNLSPSSVISSWQRALNAVALLKDLRINDLDPFGFKKISRKA